MSTPSATPTTASDRTRTSRSSNPRPAREATTANLLALGTFALLRHPAQLAAFRVDPAGTAVAVEELLRYLSVLHLGAPNRGFGVHQCLGQQLARIEMRVGLRALFERFPTLRLAVPADDVPMRGSAVVYGVRRLPVTW